MFFPLFSNFLFCLIVIAQVDDQMKLLQHAWSDLLILDHLHQRLHNHLPDESSLPNGQKFDLLSLSLLGCPQLVEPLHDVTARLTEIRFDVPDYVCLKFLMLLNSGILTTDLKKKSAHNVSIMFSHFYVCRRQGIDESTPCGRRTGASPASSIRLHAKLLRSYPCKLSYFHCSHDFVQVGRCVTDRCPRPTGQVCQNAGNLTRHPRHVDTR